MRYLESFSNYEPKIDDLSIWEKYLEENYKPQQDNILGQFVKYIIIDDKTKYITGPLAKKGELTDRLYFEISSSNPQELPAEIHEPTLRKAIKMWFDKHSGFDIDFAISRIKEKFDFTDVQELLDREIKEWTPEDQEKTFYSENSNGEAEDAVVTYLVDWYFENYPNNYTEDDEKLLKEEVKKTYDFLK